MESPSGTSACRAFPAGTSARVNPSRAASASRALGLRHRAHLAGEAHLAQHQRSAVEGAVPEAARRARRTAARSAAGSSSVHAPRHVDEEVAAEDVDADLLLQHRGEQRHPVRVDADRRPARGAVARWARRAPAPRPAAARVPESARRHGAPRRALGPLGEEERRWVRHLGEPARLHLEDADLARRAEAVLVRAQDPVRVGSARPRSRGPCPPCARARAGRRWRRPS